MRNPLFKRLPREFKEELGKYLAIFLFMAATIGFISGFLVADGSLIQAYDESFEKYKIEDGNFTVSTQASKRALERLEKEGVKIYENFFLEEPGDTDLDGEEDGTIRIFRNRKEVNLVCLMEGELPEGKDEIAIDRMYADNNGLKPGDTIAVGNKELKIAGLAALPDYSCLFSDNSDMMFDSVKFGVAIMSDEGFEAMGTRHMNYRYSWIYEEAPESEREEKEKSEGFMKALVKNTALKDFIPRYLNQAIQFTGEDMGSDKTMMEVLLYILIAIMAFVFAVTTNNTITKEASVIGTLRASGYTRGELLGHYISLPVLVTLLAAVAGNILGYTVFKDVCAGMYYGSYSLPTYETRWNAEAFVMTTIVPLALMAVINLCLISRKLRLSPLRFLRHDLSRSGKKRAVRLPGFRFFNRFRLRIILQNKSSYFTLFVGIVFANVLLLFGMMMSPLLSHYQEETVTNMLADYQYILNVPDEVKEEDEKTLLGMLQKLLTPALETKEETAEKFCVESLKNVPDDREGESVMVYGISGDSQYVKIDFPEEGVCVSEGYMEKYGLQTGDKIILKEPYGDKEYQFEIGGTYHYPAAIAVFMPMEEFWKVFEKKEDYFNGYFTRKEIEDIDESYIGAAITEDDLTKVSRQLDVSMGEMFVMVNVFAVVLFALLIYLLTKLIIEKNASSISMVKILGYENREIISLYLTSTTWIVVLSIGLSLLIATEVIRVIYVFMMAEFSGWLSFYIEPSIYPKMFGMGFSAYFLVALLQFRRIKRIPMDAALKNVE